VQNDPLLECKYVYDAFQDFSEFLNKIMLIIYRLNLKKKNINFAHKCLKTFKPYHC